MSESKSKYKELRGFSATACLDKAEIMFLEMELERDLEKLEGLRSDVQ